MCSSQKKTFFYLTFVIMLIQHKNGQGWNIHPARISISIYLLEITKLPSVFRILNWWNISVSFIHFFIGSIWKRKLYISEDFMFAFIYHLICVIALPRIISHLIFYNKEGRKIPEHSKGKSNCNMSVRSRNDRLYIA